MEIFPVLGNMGGMPDDYPVKAFPTAAAFGAWLKRHHAKAEGLWLRIYKKDSGKKTVSYAQALDEALCFGWIDGLVRSLDAESYIQKFTPRRARSRWSKINTKHVERLIEQGRMRPAGLAQVEAAKKDGRWAAAYSSPRDAKPPADFLRALNRRPRAKAFFATLNRANIYYIVYQLQDAKKPETRQRRMEKMLADLDQEKKWR